VRRSAEVLRKGETKNSLNSRKGRKKECSRYIYKQLAGSGDGL